MGSGGQIPDRDPLEDYDEDAESFAALVRIARWAAFTAFALSLAKRTACPEWHSIPTSEAGA